MKILLDNRFIKIEYYSKDSLMKHIWKLETKTITDKEYRDIAGKRADLLAHFGPKRWLIDMSYFEFVLDPKTQEWANDLFPGIFAAGIRSIAFVVSPNLFSQISVEELMDIRVVRPPDSEVMYFGCDPDATKWLMKNK